MKRKHTHTKHNWVHSREILRYWGRGTNIGKEMIKYIEIILMKGTLSLFQVNLAVMKLQHEKNKSYFKI